MAKKIDLERNCPVLKNLADQLDALITLVNELRTDYNAQSAALVSKINSEIERTEELATKFTAHLSAAHPDTTNTLTKSAVAAMQTGQNLVTSPSVEEL